MILLLSLSTRWLPRTARCNPLHFIDTFALPPIPPSSSSFSSLPLSIAAITITFTTKAALSSVEETEMVKAIRVHELGGPQVLKWEDVEIGEPKEGEVRVRNKAIGVNFVDVYFRKGVYKAPSLPFTPGVEAVGVVTAVGVGVTDRQVGDLVAYAGRPLGSYAEEQILPANKLVPVPPQIDPVIGASIMSKGMTTRFLLQRCFRDIQPLLSKLHPRS